MMWIATFFALALAGQVAQAQYLPVSYVEKIENPEAWEARIVSGWEAKPGQHPHQVSLRMVTVAGTVFGCGGNVVHREWILSAAHCIASYVTIVIRAGLVHMTRPELMLESQEYFVYPTFDVSNPWAVQPNDIAVVKLPRPLTYSNNLRPIRLQPTSEAHRNYDEEVVYASGFGLTWTSGFQSEQLNWVYLRGVSNEACASLFGSYYVTPNTVCARFFNVTSQSICQGDSGGPLVHVSADGEPTLIGLSSFVAGEPLGCHSGLPGAFIRPGPFHGWLKEVTGIDFENLVEEDETTIAPTTTELPTTLPPTTTESPTTLPPTDTTTISAPTTTPEEEEDDDNEETDIDDIDDPELAEILKRLEVKVKVKVRLSKYLKKKKEKKTIKKIE